MPKYITARVLAARLNLSLWSIYQGVKDGTLPGRRLKPRGRLYFAEDEVAQALKPDPRILELMEKANPKTAA